MLSRIISKFDVLEYVQNVAWKMYNSNHDFLKIVIGSWFVIFLQIPSFGHCFVICLLIGVPMIYNHTVYILEPAECHCMYHTYQVQLVQNKLYMLLLLQVFHLFLLECFEPVFLKAQVAFFGFGFDSWYNNVWSNIIQWLLIYGMPWISS